MFGYFKTLHYPFARHLYRFRDGPFGEVVFSNPGSGTGLKSQLPARLFVHTTVRALGSGLIARFVKVSAPYINWAGHNKTAEKINFKGIVSSRIPNAAFIKLTHQPVSNYNYFMFFDTILLLARPNGYQAIKNPVLRGPGFYLRYY
ncbi:hypothetical protein HK413_13585 [Mucilaginibacter sp. S1162]|uniref:Uncharacterized protein n=1 Tax=Mucilaginibacter humi TaxID=2732510 RepID=A0ABX1W3S8_9SPHI|nr:hypothetical protein [Mucilaginibacter humi]NNU34828.1 hypothetical protein [Mucilaginibacter humi]